jgi:hypothetical protein
VPIVEDGVVKSRVVEPSDGGYRVGMRHRTSRQLRSLAAIERTTDHAIVETDDQETIDFEGCSEAEVEAKLRDFYAWAS